MIHQHVIDSQKIIKSIPLQYGMKIADLGCGGAGHFMAQWIVDGEPELDLFELDPRRFGDYADIKYTVAKGTEVYANEYQLGYANEYAMRPAVRGRRATRRRE